jgi:hypothetical protein
MAAGLAAARRGVDRMTHRSPDHPAAKTVLRRRLAASVLSVLVLGAAGVYFAIMNPIPAAPATPVAEDAGRAAATSIPSSPQTPPAEQPSSRTGTTQPSPPARVTSPPGASGLPCPPTRLDIPGLGVDAPVIKIGLERNGTLATPSDADKNKAGWYPTVLPGSSQGSVLMDAHTYHDDTALFKTSFKHTVGIGMTMQLFCADGRSLGYRISEIKLDLTPNTYPDFVMSRRLYALDGPPQVVMITCTDWDPVSRDWNNRAILIATPTL